jgi:hypothetical protein
VIAVATVALAVVGCGGTGAPSTTRGSESLSMHASFTQFCTAENEDGKLSGCTPIDLHGGVTLTFCRHPKGEACRRERAKTRAHR